MTNLRGDEVQTNHNGRYTFPEVDGDELHIRLEKDGHEPKEVIVHRMRRTTLRDDRLSLEYGGPQDQPGKVLIGAAWPEYANQIMEKMPVVADLLMLMILVPSGRGQYGFGVEFVEKRDHALARAPKPAPERCGIRHAAVVPGVLEPATSAGPLPSGAMVRSRRAKRLGPNGHRRRDDRCALDRNPPLATFPHRPAAIAPPRTSSPWPTFVCGKLSFNLPQEEFKW